MPVSLSAPSMYQLSIRLAVVLAIILSVLAPLSAAEETSAADGWVMADNLETDEVQFDLSLIDRTQESLVHDADRQLLPLSLQQCVERALINNLDVRIASQSPAIRLSDVVRAEAAFDAVLFSSAQYDINDQKNLNSEFFERTYVTPSGQRIERLPTDPYRQSEDFNYSIGLRKRLPTGAEIELAQLLRQFRNISDEDELFYRKFHEWDLQLRLTQPLLRDFGVDVNRASIYATRNNYNISRQQFHLEVITMLQEVEQNYWALVTARQQAQIFRGLLQQAQLTQRKLDLRQKRDTNTEVYMQTQALIERARAGLIDSLSTLRQQQDRLLESINDPELPWDTTWEIIPTDTPTTIPYEVDLDEARRLSLQIRPDLIAQRLSLDNAEIAVGVAENQRLPRLDLILQQDLTGAGVNSDRAWDDQWDNETVGYAMGLSFEVPLGNRAAEAELAKAKREKRQEKMRLASLRDLINAEVSITTHRIRDNHREIVARRKAAQAEVSTLQAFLAQDRAEQGTTPSFLDRKLRAQERVANALLSLAQATLQYNVAIIEFQRAQGTLLRYNNIKITELNEDELANPNTK